MDPFALPECINSDPLRGPIFIPLALSLEEGVFIGGLFFYRFYIALFSALEQHRWVVADRFHVALFSTLEHTRCARM